VKRELQRIEIPGEHEARERTWRVVQAAFAERQRVTWPRRHARSLVLAAAGAAIIAAAVTPPGQSVVNTLRDAVGREKVVGVRPAHRELVRLPTGGRLLLNSRRGPWIVHENGSRRLLGSYRMASWSPHGKYVSVVGRGIEVAALDPKGNVRWAKGRKQRLAQPRWSFEGFRIAYLSENTLRVITGDGMQDWGLGTADPSVAPAWRAATHQLAWVGGDGKVRVADADARRVLWRASAFPDRVRALTWSSDGARLLVLGRSSVRTYRASGALIAAAPTKGQSTAAAFAPGSHRFALVIDTVVLLVDADTLRFPSRALFTATTKLSGLAWSPDAKWLLVGWPGADEFVFIRVEPPKLYAVANVAEQFDPGTPAPQFPTIAGWCCTS
jgi:hypothetical protein